MDLRTNSYYFTVQHSLIGFRTKTVLCVHCAVRTEYLNKNQVNPGVAVVIKLPHSSNTLQC